MSAEPETTLVWAEFFWRVTKETPQTVFLYLLMIDLLRRRRQAQGEQGRHLTLELSDTATASDSLTVSAGTKRYRLGIATETDTALPLRASKSVTIGRAVETNVALPIKAVGGAPS
ncbi:MAG: hypothetical protein ACRDP6_00180 [Actinoallomurus sp.]